MPGQVNGVQLFAEFKSGDLTSQICRKSIYIVDLYRFSLNLINVQVCFANENSRKSDSSVHWANLSLSNDLTQV